MRGPVTDFRSLVAAEIHHMRSALLAVVGAFCGVVAVAEPVSDPAIELNIDWHERQIFGPDCTRRTGPARGRDDGQEF